MNLTSVQRTKDYLGLLTVGSDAVIAQLIMRSSVQVQNWCSRSFQRNSYTNARLDGTGSQIMRVPDTPIISVGALTISSTVIPASADGVAYGYQFDELNVFLFGGALFPMGRRNVGMDYTAGYTTTETDFIPVSNAPTITPTTGGYATVDRGVANSSTSVAFTLVGNGPVANQYSFANGVYSFNSADSNAQVVLSYDYAPGPVEQGVIELVGGDLKQRDNLGIASKSLRDETITYSDKMMSNSVQGLLWPYRKVVPV